MKLTKRALTLCTLVSSLITGCNKDYPIETPFLSPSRIEIQDNRLKGRELREKYPNLETRTYIPLSVGNSWNYIKETKSDYILEVQNKEDSDENDKFIIKRTDVIPETFPENYTIESENSDGSYNVFISSKKGTKRLIWQNPGAVLHEAQVKDKRSNYVTSPIANLMPGKVFHSPSLRKKGYTSLLSIGANISEYPVEVQSTQYENCLKNITVFNGNAYPAIFPLTKTEIPPRFNNESQPRGSVETFYAQNVGKILEIQKDENGKELMRIELVSYKVK